MPKEDYYTNTVEDAAKFAADHYDPEDDDCDDGSDEDGDGDEDGPCCNSGECPCGGYRMGNIRRRRQW